MTDLEMTKLCESAMGLNGVEEDARRKRLDGAWRTHQETEYDPIYNNAQAMMLVKKFGIHIGSDSELGVWIAVTEHPHQAQDKDLNRAIVECVAKMQLSK